MGQEYKAISCINCSIDPVSFKLKSLSYCITIYVNSQTTLNSLVSSIIKSKVVAEYRNSQKKTIVELIRLLWASGHCDISANKDAARSI